LNLLGSRNAIAAAQTKPALGCKITDVQSGGPPRPKPLSVIGHSISRRLRL